jgi:hypothetical protein
MTAHAAAAIAGSNPVIQRQTANAIKLPEIFSKLFFFIRFLFHDGFLLRQGIRGSACGLM